MFIIALFMIPKIWKQPKHPSTNECDIYIERDPHIYMVLEKTLENQEKGMTEDKLVGWHHWFNGLEFVQALGDGEGWETWRAAVHGTAKSQTRLSDWISANIYVTVVVAKLCLTLLQPHGLWPAWLLCSWGFSGKGTGVSCHFLLQRIVLTFHHLHWQADSSPQSHQGS